MAGAPDDGDERALVPATDAAPRLVLAESLAQRQRGQVVLLDRKGQVLGRRRARRQQAVILGSMALFLAFAGVVLGPSAAIGGGIGYAVMLGFSWLRYRTLRRAVALLVAWRDDEARALLLEVQRRRHRREVASEVERLLGVLAWRRGEHQVALEHVERAIALGGGIGHLRTITRLQLVAELDPERARTLLPELDALPTTEYFVSERRYLALVIAFNRDRPDELPDDLELHDWARAALDDNLGGGRLGLLAWAFDRRGDREMSELLLREVEAHLPVPLARTAPMWPRLHAWLAPRIAALPVED